MNEAVKAPAVEAQSLTNWKNPPQVKDLKQDLMDAKPTHDTQVTKINTYLDNLNMTGGARPKVQKGSSAIAPRLIRKQAEWRYTALSEPFLSTEDLFTVSPTTKEDRKAAQQNTLLLNYQFNIKIDRVKFIDEFVRAAVDEGTVVLRTGWDFEEEEYQEEVPDVQFSVNPSLGPLHQQLAQMKAESPSLYATDVPDELKQAHDLTMERGEPIEAIIIGYKTVTKTRTVKNCPTVEVREARNVIIDPSCLGDITKASFVIDSFESSLSQLRKDKKYKNLDSINIGANSILGQPDYVTNEGSKNFNFSDEPRKKFVVYEYWGYWDINGDGLVKPFVAAWVGDTMIRLEESPFPDNQLPYIIEHYLPVRKATYGEPDGALLEDNQKVVGAVTRGMIDIMGKSANGQTGIRKDMLDMTNRRKFERGQDYEFNVNVDPRQGVFMHTFPEIPASAQFMLQMQNMEAESLTGVKAFSNTGVSGAALGDVASLGRSALDAASKRELGILRRLKNAIIKVGRKFISMNSEFLSDEEVVRLTDEEFVTVRRDDLAGEFDLKLSITTAEEDEKKAQELAFMLQTAGPSMDPEMHKMILADIARLRKMPDLAAKIEAYQPQPDPIAQKTAQLEVELLMAKISRENAQAQEALARAGLTGAKTNTEGARAQHLQSDTDLKNLNYVEQESGVTQERDLQKAGEQARSQAQLKVLDNENRALDRKHDLLKEYIKANTV